MTSANEADTIVRIAGKRSVDIALDLLRTTANKTSKRKRKEETDDKDKVALHCLSNLVDRRDKNAALGFSENHAITEMRSCISRHDWASLRDLFPLILGCYNEIEPILWRYAITILLCTPDGDSSYLQEFLEMCIGAQTLEDSHLLERLLTLPDS